MIVESEAYHRTLIETSPNAIITTDVEGIISFASARTYDMFRIPESEQVLNISFLQWVYHEDLDLAIERFGGIISGNKMPAIRAFKLLRYDKTVFTAEFSSSPILNSDKDIIGLHLNIHDIDENVKMVEELNRAKIQAEESDRLKEAFIRNISHELRTPMNSLVGFSELLKEPDISDDDRNFFSDNIISGTKQLLTVISTMVDMSSISAGQVKAKPGDVYPLRMLGKLIDNYAYRAESKNLTLTLKVKDEDREAMLYLDEIILTKALGHILDNAIKFTKSGGVKIELSATGESLTIYIRDTGSGIPDEYQTRIFDPFFQVDHGFERISDGCGLDCRSLKDTCSCLKEYLT